MQKFQVGDKVKLTSKSKKSLRLAGVKFRASWTVTQIVNGFVVTDEQLDTNLVVSTYDEDELERYPYLWFRRFHLDAIQKA